MTQAPPIGHNVPPPLDAMSLHIEDLFSLASGSTASPIMTDDQEAALDSLLDDIRNAKKEAEAQCETEYRPHKKAGDSVKAAWKPLFVRCDAAAIACKEALTPYRTAKQRAKGEAARKAREEAEALQKQAQEALQTSDDLSARFQAEQELETAKKLAAAANKIDRSATGLRTTWEAEVTDRALALRHYLKANPEAFMELIQRLADRDAQNEATRRSGIGITFHERKRAA